MAEFCFSKDYQTLMPPDVGRPRYLYKYRSLAGSSRAFSEALIKRSEIYFAKPEELNDPFDCRPHNTMQSTTAERKAFLTWVTKGREPALGRAARRRRVVGYAAQFKSQLNLRGFEAVAQDAYDRNLGDTGVFSMSADPTSNLMWSHYGDSHRGICVRFDFSGLLQICPLPVVYSQERPSYNMFREVNALESLAFLRKSSEWSYEQEWRAVGLWSSGKFGLQPSAITGIILGAGISPEDRATVLGWSNDSERQIDIQQARFQAEDYQLKFEPVAD
jgi:Protein of unknown function (DUF2971)